MAVPHISEAIGNSLETRLRDEKTKPYDTHPPLRDRSCGRAEVARRLGVAGSAACHPFAREPRKQLRHFLWKTASKIYAPDPCATSRGMKSHSASQSRTRAARLRAARPHHADRSRRARPPRAGRGGEGGRGARREKSRHGGDPGAEARVARHHRRDRTRRPLTGRFDITACECDAVVCIRRRRRYSSSCV